MIHNGLRRIEKQVKTASTIEINSNSNLETMDDSSISSVSSIDNKTTSNDTLGIK